MNQELSKAIKLYATKSHKDFSEYLLGNSKDTLIGSDLKCMIVDFG